MRLLAFLLLLFAGCIAPYQPTPEPPAPPVVSDIEAATRDALRSYASGMADAFHAAADAGHDDAAAANEALAKANKEARLKAFAELDSILDERIGGENWDAKTAADLFREIGDGFGELK